uniref:BPTI/Kunitz inhibitor domain-containing protein n=1 Tax=Electrophorus electricus TaxID=8005 RepID=A0A4W4F7V3_ELEEL
MQSVQLASLLYLCRLAAPCLLFASCRAVRCGSAEGVTAALSSADRQAPSGRRCMGRGMLPLSFYMLHSCLYLCALDSCILPLDEGSCSRYTLRWYFNSQVSVCRPFIYSGCGGNANRFTHKEECEQHCLPLKEGIQMFPL